VYFLYGASAPEGREMKNRKSGFTLVEILIVVIILGILAAIVIPQFTDASTSAKTNALESNLQMLRSQFELYKVQHDDLYPWDDAATVANDLDSNANIATKLTTKGVDDLGPYMQSVPGNPFCPAHDPVVFAAAATDDGTVDWAIDVATLAITDGYTGHP